MAIITGTARVDFFNGTSGDDLIRGLTSNDFLSGGDGNDVFEVANAEGFDNISGGIGTDVVFALKNYMYIGLKNLDSSSSVEFISAGRYYNVRIINGPSSRLDFSNTTFIGIESIQGDAGFDIITGSRGSDNIFTNDGNDYVNDSGGLDIINGGAGKDTFNPGLNTNGQYAAQQSSTNQNVWTLTNTGTVGLSSYSVTLNTDGTRQVIGSDGRVSTLQNFEIINFVSGGFGSNGDDTMTGGTRNEIYVGLSGNDTLAGGAGDDTLLGGVGNDSLSGDAGDDLLLGGAGVNRLDGGDGNDFFAHSATDGETTVVEAPAAAGGAQDVIYFADAPLSSLEFYQIGSDLVVGTNADVSDLVVVQNYFAADAASKSGVEYLQDYNGDAYYLPTLFG